MQRVPTNRQNRPTPLAMHASPTPVGEANKSINFFFRQIIRSKSPLQR